jgi:hypothetical protein
LNNDMNANSEHSLRLRLPPVMAIVDLHNGPRSLQTKKGARSMKSQSILQILVVFALVIIFLVGCGSQETAPGQTPVVVSKADDAFFVELTYEDLPYPTTPPDDGKGATYVLDVVYVQNASTGEAINALVKSKGEQHEISLMRGANYGKPGLDTVFMAIPLESVDQPDIKGVELIFLLGEANWTDGNKLSVLVPRTLKAISGETLVEFPGKGKAALRLAPYGLRYSDSTWQSEPVEVDLDFSIFQ